MNRWVCFCATWLLLCVPWTSVHAQERRYYVSPTGNDAAAGTAPETAWRTLARVNRQQFAAGDQILLQGGASFAGNLLFDAADQGSAAAPIVIGSYGIDRAIIEAGTGNGVLVQNSGGYLVRDLDIRGSQQHASLGAGVVFLNTLPAQTKLQFIRIENVLASGFGYAGVMVTSAPADGSQSGYADVRISNCQAWNNVYFGIVVTGFWDEHAATYANRDVTIADCVAHDNAGDPLFTKQHSGSGILLDNVEGGLIEHCTAFHNGFANGSLGGGPVGIWAHSARRVTIQFCESFDNRTPGKADGGGFDFDGGVSDSVLQYNFSHDNDGPGLMLWNYQFSPHRQERNVVRYNVSWNDARRNHYGGLQIGTDGEPVREADIYHNTIITNASTQGTPRALWLGYYNEWHPCQNIRLRNNLFVTTGATPLFEISPAQTGIELQGNAYWNTQGTFVGWDGKQSYASLAQWRTAMGQERWNGVATGYWGNPHLATSTQSASVSPLSWRLRLRSPLIDRGLNLAAMFGLQTGTRDFAGTPLPQGKGSDIGAHEWTRQLPQRVPLRGT